MAYGIDRYGMMASGGAAHAIKAWALALSAVAAMGGCAAEHADPVADVGAPTPGSDAGVADAGLTDRGPEVDPDGGPAAPESGFPLTLGLGARRFDPVEHGAVALLHRGCQGAQHIWLSLRSPALAPGEHVMTLSARQAASGAEAVPAHDLELPWLEGPDGGAELVGVTLVIFDPLAVVDAEVDVFAEVLAPDGRVGRAVRRLRIEWGPDEC